MPYSAARSIVRMLAKRSNLPLHRNPAQRGVFEFVGLFGAEVAVFVDAAGEEVLHQAGLDALLLGDQRFRLFNRPVHRREDLGDLGLLGFGCVGNGQVRTDTDLRVEIA